MRPYLEAVLSCRKLHLRLPLVPLCPFQAGSAVQRPGPQLRSRSHSLHAVSKAQRQGFHNDLCWHRVGRLRVCLGPLGRLSSSPSPSFLASLQQGNDRMRWSDSSTAAGMTNAARSTAKAVVMTYLRSCTRRHWVGRQLRMLVVGLANSSKLNMLSARLTQA